MLREHIIKVKSYFGIMTKIGFPKIPNILEYAIMTLISAV
jgi:hypothetical protein